MRKQREEVPSAPEGGGYEEGMYRPEITEATYRALLEAARQLLGRGSSVILDASWSVDQRRRSAAQVASECSAELVALRCEAPFELAAERIERRRHGADPSDATPTIAGEMSSRFDDWPEAEAVDTSVEPDAALTAAVQAIDRQLEDWPH